MALLAAAGREQKEQGDQAVFRDHLKNVFWPNFCVGRSVPILEILEYSSGWNLTAALTLNQNPIFEIVSIS
jgi:hypothetical protein